MPLTPDDRLTLLERAQQLHDDTMRRHNEMFAHQAERTAQHKAQLAFLRQLHDEQTTLQAQHEARMVQATQTHKALVAGVASLETRFDRVEAALLAIKDLLDRPNGR